jgi:5'-nucleotidase
MSQSRRGFIKSLGAGVAGASLLSSFDYEKSLNVLKKMDLIQLTILHTNDMHSRVESFPANHRKYPGQGGLLNVGAKIKQVREQEGEILLLDAGDIFQGTPYFNEFGGELEFKMMSQLRYDCATMGNHDFDNGLSGFDKMLPFANFPFVTSNYDFTDTILAGKTEQYKIVEKKGLKIGIFGVGVAFDGLVSKKNYGATKYLDPIVVANEMAQLLKDKGCELVVCLSHLGYKYKNTKVCDIDLAKSTHNIDLIIGGHTHTFLEMAETHFNSKGEKVLINQAGWSALSLGRVDFVFSESEKQVVDDLDVRVLNKNYANF